MMRLHFVGGTGQRCTDLACSHAFHYLTQKDALAAWETEAAAFFASHFALVPDEPHICF